MSSQNKSNPVLMTAAFFVIIAGLFLAKTIAASLLLAIFITVICIQPIRWMKAKRVPQGLAIIIVFVFIIGVFIGFGQLIFWGFVLGILGIFLLVPLTMAIKIILEQNPQTKGIAIFLGTEVVAQQTQASFANHGNKWNHNLGLEQCRCGPTQNRSFSY